MTSLRRSLPKRISSWQDKLSALDLNNIHKSRTCEVFFMVEHDESCSIAIEKFKKGAGIDPMNSLKSIRFEDILKNIEIFSQDAPNPKIEHILYRNVAQKAASYLNSDESIPRDLLANLIKLQIALTISEDVVMTQKKILWEQNLDKECEAFVVSTEPAGKDKKGKDKKGKDKKDKDKKGKDQGKGKGKGGKDTEKVYDICDSNNDLKFKPTSPLARQAKDTSVAHETIPVDPKHLFVVLVGFYDFHLIEELHKLAVQITGIVELTKPSIEHKCMSLGDEDELGSVLEDDKTGILYFWNKIYEYLEGPDGCPLYLNNTIHMTVSLPEQSFDGTICDDKQCECDDRECLEVFSDIGSAVVKSPDIQRQHVNYIRHLKICPVGPRPTKMQPSHFEIYNKIMNVFPPDCSNIFTIVYALVEEVRHRVPDPPRIILETPPPSSGTSDQDSVDNSLLKGNSKMYHGIKGEIAKLLDKNFKSHNKTQADNDEHNFDPKLNIKISNKPFLVQENNDLEIMANSYEKLRSKLLAINAEKLVISNTSVLLWKGYPYNEEEQQKVLTKIYRLQSVAEDLDVPLHELQYIIHTIIFNSLKCKSLKSDNKEDSCSLQLIFPQKSSTTIPNVIKKHVPCKPAIETFETSEESLDMEIPYVPYLDKPNLYEAKNLSAYKWYETLSSLVILQELFKADQNYLCVDYRYCTFDDSILLRYHNDLDEFGINTKIWDQSLRTPISSIREFCKYVIHVESRWIEQQEEKYIAKFESDVECSLKENHAIKQNFYPDLIFNDGDFIQSRSIKGKMLEELRKPVLTVDTGGKTKGKGGKGDKKGKDKSKGKDSKAASSKGKGKGEKAGPASQIVLLEKLSKPPAPPERRKLSLRSANQEEPFSFYAYDVSNSRVQLTGSTSVFQSQDGFRVTVDQTRFVAKPKKLSINICINDHSLILHHNQATLLEPFTFHFALSDRTMIAFAKPLQIPTPEEKLGEKICQALKRKTSEKRQEIYFISEKQRSVLKCFNIPYITRRNLILSEDLIIPFLNQLSIRGIKTRLALTETLSSSEVEQFEEAVSVQSKHSLTTIESNSTSRPAPPKYLYDVISKVVKSENVLKVEEEQEEVQILEKEHVKSRRSLSEDSVQTIPLRRSNKKLLKKIRKVVESHLPIFKICSSKLHQHQYVKRIKSRIEIPIGTVLKRIPCKAALAKPRINLKISKLLPVKPCSSKSSPTKYDIRISLPSGLSIQSIEGTEGSSFNIRQRYCDKGPQSKNIAHEYSRTFTRTGNIIIKKCDGNVDVLGVGGQQVQCEIPYVRVKSVFTPKEKQCPKRTANHLIPLHTSSLTTFQKQLNRSINRLRKHLIDGYQSQHLISHRACQRWKKNYIKDTNQVYILQSSLGNLKKFSLITSDGKKLNVTPSIITEEKIYYTATATDYRYQEIYHGREDGTHSIINHESLLVTQFPDGTRLTTWIEIECDMLYLEEREEVVEGTTRNEEQQVYECDLQTTIDVPESASEEDTIERFSTMTFQSETATDEQSTESLDSLKTTIDEGWVSIHLNVKYEHPNYATVIYYGSDNHSEIVLPNNVTITASSKGEYVLNIGQNICTNITTEEILLDSRLCSTCFQKSTNKLNIKPLYYKSQLNQHETELLRTTDTFKKVFIVNYDGQCFRNVNYQQGRINLAGCRKHFNFENQKLFILTRSLIGCKLWDINSYRTRLTGAKRSGTDVHESESRIELRNYVKEPYHERFLIPYHELTLVLTKNKPKQFPPKELAYVTRQVINTLPESSKFYQIYSTLLKLSSGKDTRISETVIGEFAAFLDHVVDGILGKHKRPSDFIKKLPKVPSVHKKLDSIPFYVRHEKWLEECAKHWTNIREHNVPQYFNSKYFYLVSGITPPSSKSNSSSETVCECNKRSDSPPCDCDIHEEFGTNPNSSFGENASDKTFDPFAEMEERDQESGPSLTNETSDSRSSVAHPTSSVSEDTKPSNPELKPEKPEAWYETDLGRLLLTETKIKTIKIALETTAIELEDVSAEKIERATKLLVNDFMMAVEKFETDISREEYITMAVNSTVDKILEMQLNPVELILLLNNVEQVRFLQEISSLCSPMLASTITGEGNGDLEDIFVPCKAPPKKMEQNQDSSQEDLGSYFGVYGYYSNIEEELKPKSKEEPPTLKAEIGGECETSDLSLQNTTAQCVPGVGIDSTCKSDLPCHSEDKFWFKKYKEKCDKCTEHTELERPHRDSSKASVTYSEADIIFSIPSVDKNETVPVSSNSTSSTIENFDSLLVNKSSEMIPTNIEISPDSSLLEYCLSENLATIDDSTVVLQRADYNETPSKMVLFSVASLKNKDLENPLPGPYIQRNPDDAAEAIENIVANTKTMPYKVQQTSNVRPTHEDLPRQPEKSLVREESLHKCRKCILQLEEELSKSESLSGFRTKSVVSLLAALKRAGSDAALSGAKKEKITTSIMNITENLPLKSRPPKQTNRLFSKISDEDVKVIKGIRPIGSRTLLQPTRVGQNVTRRTVGSQTQPNVDRMNQTWE